MNITTNFWFTPQKDKQDDELKLINSPSEVRQDLYESLINVSPSIKLSTLDQISSQEIIQEDVPNSSEMLNQDSESEIGSEQQTRTKFQNRDKWQQCISKKIITPKKNSKGCHCEKSHCLKKYCDCFKIGEVCGQDCLCVGCQNDKMTDRHTQQVKLLQLTRSGKGGKQSKCNCQKSHCLKNYCECHSAGKTCSSNCNCLQCQNKHQFSNKGKKKKNLSISSWDVDPLRKQNIFFS